MTDSTQPAPAQRWDHDRRLLANWLLRDAGSRYDGAEIRGDGSSFVRVITPVGPVALHDYWSFARVGFVQDQRAQSYQQILQAQVPILSFGYTRPAKSPAQLIVFLNGELDTAQGTAGSFLPLLQGKAIGELVSIENSSSDGAMTDVALYDEFLREVLKAALAKAATNPPR